MTGWADLTEEVLYLVSILGGVGIIISSPLRPLSRSGGKNLTSVIFLRKSQHWVGFLYFHSELQTESVLPFLNMIFYSVSSSI